jgi:hypothetical protein
VRHAQALLRAIDELPSVVAEALPGLYLEVTSRPNERLKKDSLGSSGIKLLRSDVEIENGITTEIATVFATGKGVEKLRKKVEEFRTEDMPDREKDGKLIPGRPKNAVWRSPQDKFPDDADSVDWEIWLEPESADAFIQQAVGVGVLISTDRLRFPEDLVVIG